jgi:hypothetical protein
MDSNAKIPDLTEEESNKLQQAVNFWLESAKNSAETRNTFHNQLAVLSAGSIAVIASGTVAVLSWEASAVQRGIQPPAINSFRGAVTTASAALLVALFCCILHNFLETVLQERKSGSTLGEMFIKVVEMAVNRSGAPEDTKLLDYVKKKSEKKAQLSLHIKTAQLWTSGLAVLSFIVGFGALIFLIWTEAKLL